MKKYNKPEIITVDINNKEAILEISAPNNEVGDKVQLSKSRYVDFSSEDSDFGF